MQISAKTGPAFQRGHRASLDDVIGLVRRARAAIGQRSALRPLQEIDCWSDQAEVAYYEMTIPSRSY